MYDPSPQSAISRGTVKPLVSLWDRWPVMVSPPLPVGLWLQSCVVMVKEDVSPA